MPVRRSPIIPLLIAALPHQQRAEYHERSRWLSHARRARSTELAVIFEISQEVVQGISILPIPAPVQPKSVAWSRCAVRTWCPS